MTLEAVAWVILLAVVAAALVALNRGLQRLARPDKGDERIAGCCGMALPEELLRSDTDINPMSSEYTNRSVSIGRARDTGATPGREGPITEKAPSRSREEYHEL